jgi:hypothetical protein
MHRARLGAVRWKRHPPIYNRYGYVKEMRRVLGLWAKELTTSVPSNAVEEPITAWFVRLDCHESEADYFPPPGSQAMLAPHVRSSRLHVQ